MLTLKQHIRLNKNQYKIVKDYARFSNNLYNFSIYIAKEHFKQTNKYIGIKNLFKVTKENENYKLLPSQSAQQIIRLVDKNFRSFFALLTKKNLGQYNDKIKPPSFKPKGGLFNIIFCYQNAYIKKNKIYFCKSKYYKERNKNKLELEFSYELNGKIKQIILQPKNNGQYFMMIINYEENKINKEVKNYENYLSIDLGIDNLAACFDNVSGRSFILSGKLIKSYNRYYNKIKSCVQSELKTKNDKNWSKRLQNISKKRYNFINNYFNQNISYIIKYLCEHNIGNIVVGYNMQWKQNINLGKINNQKFMDIPYSLFKQKLENKCKQNNINFILIEETYTSKCSSLDLEKLGKHKAYQGKRIKRGLFKSQNGTLINADINGAINILRKVISDEKINLNGTLLNTKVVSNVI